MDVLEFLIPNSFAAGGYPPTTHPGWRKLGDYLTDVPGFSASPSSETELLRAAREVTRSERSSAQAAGLAAIR